MIVNLKGNKSGLEVTFMDSDTYSRLFGYPSINMNYINNVNETLTFIGSNFYGFFNSLGITSETDKGAGEVGFAWRGNAIGEKLITWNFRPVLHGNNGRSPQSVLNALLISGDTIMVTVEGKYTCEFYFISDTSTESGVISLASADTNDGVMWNAGTITYDYYVLEQNSCLPKLLPQELLKSNTYTVQTDMISESQQNPLITISGETHGIWSDFELITENQKLIYDNTVNRDTQIIIDSEAKTITNQDGIDRFKEIFLVEGSTKYPIIKVGKNIWSFDVNINSTQEEIFREIPTDMRLSVGMKNLTSTIVLELN